jgi:hypothetical protein
MRALLKLLGDTPENEAKPLLDTYNAVLNQLGLVDRNDPLEDLGKGINDFGESGYHGLALLKRQEAQHYHLGLVPTMLRRYCVRPVRQASRRQASPRR